jgi:hypothetical protein
MLPKQTIKPTEKVLAMGTEGSRAKRKTIDKASTPTVASKHPKVTASSPQSYQATVRPKKKRRQLVRMQTLL